MTPEEKAKWEKINSEAAERVAREAAAYKKAEAQKNQMFAVGAVAMLRYKANAMPGLLVSVDADSKVQYLGFPDPNKGINANFSSVGASPRWKVDEKTGKNVELPRDPEKVYHTTPDGKRVDGMWLEGTWMAMGIAKPDEVTLWKRVA